MDLRGVEPLLVGLGLGQLGLELGVVDDAAFFQVDEEHLARLQAPFLDDAGLVDGQHAHFRAHDDAVVVGDHVARRTQPIAIEGGTDLAAVGEGNGGGAVPGLHQRRVVFVKGAAVRVHQRVVVPGLGNHHHGGVAERIAAGHQQFQGIVEGRRIRGAVADQGPELFQIRTQLRRLHGLAPRRHPVDVAAQRVDLAVVAEEAEGLGQAPRGKGVGGKALVHQRQRGLGPFILEVAIIARQVGRQHHGLVANRARRQRRHVIAVGVRHTARPEHMMGLLADDE